MSMRKFLACLMVAALLCTLTACGKAEKPAQATTVEATTETTAETIMESTAETTVPTATVSAEAYSFATFYAVTPTHIYTMETWKPSSTWWGKLVCAPLNDISKKMEIPLPKEHKGRTLCRPRICGITPEWIFVNMENPFGNVVYRVSLETGKAEFMSECFGLAWYNAGSDSLLLAQEGRLEALDASTGERSVIYENKDFGVDLVSDIWYALEDGTLVLECDGYLRIDATNQVQKEPEELDWDVLFPARQSDLHVDCYGWQYYVEYGDDSNNLYRVKPDGTGKELLRAKTHAYQLLAMSGKLFALAEYPREDSGFSMADIMLHELGVDGKPLWSKKCGTSSENSGIGMFRLGGFIMVYEGIAGGGHGEHFIAIYDPVTGKALGNLN